MARLKSKRRSTNAAREVEWAHLVRSLWESSVGKLSDLWEEQFKLASGDQNDTFPIIANLARVSSAESLKKLRRGIFYAVQMNQVARKSPPVVAGPKKRALIELRKATKLARDLATIASKFDREAQDALIYVQCHRPDYGRWGVGEPYFRIFTEFAELCSEAFTVIRAGTIDPPKKSNPRGRPRGDMFSFEAPDDSLADLAEFTLILLLEVRAAGGRLRLNKNTGNGTLVEVLELLRPHVRPGLIPNNLPLSTLARVKALDEKIATAPRSPDVIQS